MRVCHWGWEDETLIYHFSVNNKVRPPLIYFDTNGKPLVFTTYSLVPIKLVQPLNWICLPLKMVGQIPQLTFRLERRRCAARGG